jgi:hypothetical protein
MGLVPSRWVQHDVGGAAGASAHHGDLLLNNALCAGLQPVLQNHRAHPEQMCHRQVRLTASQPAGLVEGAHLPSCPS